MGQYKQTDCHIIIHTVWAPELYLFIDKGMITQDLV